MSSTGLPHSVEAERVVLGAVLLQGVDVLPDLCPPLVPDSFYLRSHRIIFGVAVDMWKSGNPIDTITVTTRLKELGHLESVGGPHYLGGLSGAFPTSAHLEYYRKIIDEKHRLRQLLDLSAAINRDAYETDDVGEFLAHIQASLIRLLEGQRTDNMLEDACKKVLARAEAIRDSVWKIVGIETGIPLFDKYLGGLVQSRMTVIAARPGAGKTALVDQIISHMLDQGHPAMIFQKDMSPDEFLMRMACGRAGKSMYRMERGFLKREELDQVMEEAKRISKLPFHLYSPAKVTGADVRAIVAREKRKNGIKAVFVDHIRSLAGNGREEHHRVTENSDQIRQSCNESGLPHVVLAHINREGAKEDEPRLVHVRGGDALECDCDTGIVMWAPNGRSEDGSPWEVTFNFEKNRYGPTGPESLMFNGSRMRFENMPPAK